jgi:hypothetical protein
MSADNWRGLARVDCSAGIRNTVVKRFAKAALVVTPTQRDSRKMHLATARGLNISGSFDQYHHQYHQTVGGALFSLLTYATSWWWWLVVVVVVYLLIRNIAPLYVTKIFD